jgi:hypothetical protein
MEEFDKASTTIFRGKKLVDRIIIDGVEDNAMGFSESITVEKDVRHSPGSIAMGASYVVSGCGVKGCGVVSVKCVMGSELEHCTLESAQFAG